MGRHLSWRPYSVLLVLTSSALILAGCSAAAQQEKWPSKAITMVVSFAAGGGSDSIARVQAKYLSEELGQPINILNKPGGLQIPAVQTVLGAPADGYTLLAESNTVSSLQSMQPDLPYKLEDRAYGPMMAAGPLVIAVNATSPYRSLKELTDAAKADPASIKWGFLGGTTTVDIALAMMLIDGGVDIGKTTPVTFDGAGPAMVAVAGNHINVSADGATSVLPLLKAGQVRALAVTSDKRIAALPDLPTTIEQGFPRINVVTWFGVSGPKNLSKDIVARLDAAAKKVSESQGFFQDVDKLGRAPQYMPSDKTKEFVLKEAEQFKSVWVQMPKPQ